MWLLLAYLLGGTEVCVLGFDFLLLMMAVLVGWNRDRLPEIMGHTFLSQIPVLCTPEISTPYKSGTSRLTCV